MPVQVPLVKSAAVPAQVPVVYRPPYPAAQLPAGYVPGRVVQAPMVVPSGQPMPVQRIVRTALPLAKGTAPRPNTVGGPAYSQSAYAPR